MAYDRNEMKVRWFTDIGRYGVNCQTADVMFEAIEQHYTEPHRRYHTLDHIQQMLDDIQRFYPFAPSWVFIDAWLHDIIYNGASRSNEEDSAIFAEHFLEGRVPKDAVAKIVKGIRLSADHDVMNCNPEFYPVLVPDLIGLAAPWAVYLLNGIKIRAEYSQFTDDEWLDGRKAFIAKFCGRPRIFPAELRFDEYEIRARGNMQRELESL